MSTVCLLSLNTFAFRIKYIVLSSHVSYVEYRGRPKLTKKKEERRNPL